MAVTELVAPEATPVAPVSPRSTRLLKPGWPLSVLFLGFPVWWAMGLSQVIFLLVAVLSYSRRLFVRAFLSERQDDWREGIAGAFTHFGGVPRTLLGDNARALVVGRDRGTGTVLFHPTYLAFCRDWDVQPRACAPYRARTKGKTEAGVKFVKRNGLAEHAFDSFAALDAHLAAWMVTADAREHGTTHEAPRLRFDRAERAMLRPLPARALPRREQHLRRRVAHDAFVDVDTVRYSVPYRLIRDYVDVAIDIALGYSMVVVLMEDAKREIDDAQTQLRVTHDQLRRAALYDTMTDSLNRQAFAEGVGLEMVRATFGTVVLADLDNLKTVNDRFGHAAGDRMLRRCADVIRATLRPYDKLYRWGGDEFLLIVPSARSSDVMKRLHEALAAAEPITLESDMPLADLRLQVSLGASDYSSSEELHFAIERADRAMYQDKTRRKTDPRGYARVLDTPVSLPIVQS